MSAITREKLEELKKKDLQRATAESIGLDLRAKDGVPGGLEALEEAKRRIEAYLKMFLAPGEPHKMCVGCETLLIGKNIIESLGSTFEWGIAHGEGHCAKCGYPARGIHRVKLDDKDGELVINQVLQYAPEGLEIRPPNTSDGVVDSSS